MKNKLFLQLFADGGEGGSGGVQGKAAGNDAGTQTAGSYTLDQLDEIASARAEKASRAALADFFRKQGMNEGDITTAISDYKEKKKSSSPDVTQITKERDEALAKLEESSREKVLSHKSVRPEFMSYVLFEVGKQVTDKLTFERAAEEYLKKNPQYAGAAQGYRITTSTQGMGNAGTQNPNEQINAMIRREAGK